MFVNRVVQGIVAGLIFGVVDVLLMIPLSIPNKGIAMLASFINRFAIGFLVVNTNLPVPGWVKGMLIAKY